MRFFRTLVGSVVAKILAGLVVAFLAVIGFGSDYWVGILIGWAADPLNLTLNVVRLIFILVGIILIAILIWPFIKIRFWPARVSHVENIILAAGLPPPSIPKSTTTPTMPKTV